MRVRSSIRTAVAPAVLILAAGTGMARLPGSATAAVHTSRLGKAVLVQAGALTSSVVRCRTRAPRAASPSGGVVWAVGTQEIPGQCCLRTLALHTSEG